MAWWPSTGDRPIDERTNASVKTGTKIETGTKLSNATFVETAVYVQAVRAKFLNCICLKERAKLTVVPLASFFHSV